MNIEAIRNYTVNRNQGDIRLTVDEDNDYEITEYSSYIRAQLKYFILANEMEDMWIKICPEWSNFPELDELKVQHIDWLDNLPDPKFCLRFMEEHKILEKAKRHDRELYSHFLEIVALWNDGFKVFLS